MKDKLLYHLLNFYPIKLPNKVQKDSWANLYPKVTNVPTEVLSKIINSLRKGYPLW